MTVASHSLPGLLTARDAGEHRTEESRAVKGDNRGADILADQGDAFFVAGPKLGVVGVRVSGVCQVGGKPALGQRLGDDDAEVLFAAVVDQGAHGVVERLDDLRRRVAAGRQ